MPNEGFIREKARPIIAAASAAVVLGVGMAACGSSSEKSNPGEFQVSQDQLDQYCSPDKQWGTDQYQGQIGNGASPAIESLSGSDVDAMKTDVASANGANNLYIAYAKTLQEYQSQPVNFADINENANNNLSISFSNAEQRQKDCEQVISKTLTQGEHVTVKANSYLEVVPVYDEAGKLVSGKLADPDPRAEVSGFWTKTEQGELPVVLTPEGRLFIAKTLGNESSSFDPNGQPQTFIDQNGNEIEVTILPDGTVKERATGNTTGSGANQDGTNTSGNGEGGGADSSEGECGGCGTGNGGGGSTSTTTGGGHGTTTTTKVIPSTTTTTRPVVITTTTTAPPTTLPPKDTPKPTLPPPSGF